MSQSQSSSGIGLGGLLFAIFMTLKLTGVIHWSWWWVFAPFWVPLIAFIIIFGILGFFMLIADEIGKK